jgi:hypothetical protein
MTGNPAALIKSVNLFRWISISLLVWIEFRWINIGLFRS